jgi:hypothetical protein
MERIVRIDGKDIPFKASAALPLRYKTQFGKDFFADMSSMGEIEKDFSKINSEIFYQIIWTLAKCADANIPPLIEWVDLFDEFPVFSIFAEVSDLLDVAMKTSKN